MLYAFFRSEVPNPWPNAPTPARSVPAAVPAPAADGSRRLWPSSPYFSMAAAVALLLAGYTWLAGQFPPPQDPARPVSGDPNTAKKDHLRPLFREGVAPLRHGGEARFREGQIPGDPRIFIHVEESKHPSPPR
jgi:hypothetical protein